MSNGPWGTEYEIGIDGLMHNMFMKRLERAHCSLWQLD